MTKDKGQFFMIIDRIGNWNPQLFRELKGRLTGRNLAIATALSLLGQLIIGMTLQSRLPAPKPPTANSDWHTNSVYCIDMGEYYYANRSRCISDGLGYWQIDWQHFWWDMAAWSSVVILVALTVGGVYLLVGDLAKEQQRGTLNFIRLSPQSSESILMGKILGVPILVYLAAALVLPLHFGSAIAAGLSIDTIFRFYLLATAGCGLFYTAALLLGFLGGSAWLACLGAGLLNYPYLWLFWLMFPYQNSQSWSDLQWFDLPIGKHPDLLQVFIFCNLILGAFWLWQAVNRRFRNPSTTVLSKRQSYYAMACFQVIVLGLILSYYHNYNSYKNDYIFEPLYRFAILNLFVFLLWTAALSPHRQIVQEWARYNHLNRVRKSTLKEYRRSQIREWMFGEKSPAFVAIAVNLAITAIVWMPSIFLIPSDKKAIAVVAFLSMASLLWIYAAIAQILLLLKTKKREALAIGSVAAAIALPPIVGVVLFIAGVVLSADTLSDSGVWIFSVFGIALLEANSISLSISTIALGFLGQVGVMGALSWQLHRITHKLGASDTQLLLQERRVLAE